MAPGTPLQSRRVSQFSQSGIGYRSPSATSFNPRQSLASSRRDSSIYQSSDHGSVAASEVFPDAAIGDSVEVPGGWHGVVQYVGRVEGRDGTFLGIDLIDLDADKGRNDGTYKGVKYFTTKSSTSGMFAPQGRCRILDRGKKERNNDLGQPARHLNIRPNSRMRSVSGLSAPSPNQSRQVSGDYGELPIEVAQQKLLNENARLSQELEEVRTRLIEVQQAKAIQAQEMDELMASVAELETFISTQGNESHTAELEQLRAHLADREAKIEELRREAEERRTEFRQVTEHQQATIEELKSYHDFQIAELAEKNTEMEERLLSSGTNGLPAGIEAEDMERQIAEMTQMFDVLTEEQANARLDIELANDRIGQLEQENERLLDELTDSRSLLAQRPINGPRSPGSRRTSILGPSSEESATKKRSDDLELEVERLKAENDSLRAQIPDPLAQAPEPDISIEELKLEIKKYEFEAGEARNELRQLQEALKQERATREQMEDQNARMEETLERTIMQMNSSAHLPTKTQIEAKATVPTPAAVKSNHAIENEQDAGLENGVERCEYCGAIGHDIINCSNVFGSTHNSPAVKQPAVVPTDEDEDEEY